ncbi:hypothetical protein DFH06DRAFT_1237623 [Mycena polygramma]|nr:hypothetical protein DFH06DRAFT_1237623 [Mycena polygramma]
MRRYRAYRQEEPKFRLFRTEPNRSDITTPRAHSTASSCTEFYSASSSSSTSISSSCDSSPVGSPIEVTNTGSSNSYASSSCSTAGSFSPNAVMPARGFGRPPMRRAAWRAAVRSAQGFSRDGFARCFGTCAAAATCARVEGREFSEFVLRRLRLGGAAIAAVSGSSSDNSDSSSSSSATCIGTAIERDLRVVAVAVARGKDLDFRCPRVVGSRTGSDSDSERSESSSSSPISNDNDTDCESAFANSACPWSGAGSPDADMLRMG